VRWSIGTDRIILDMIPFKKTEKGKYQNKSSIIQKNKDGTVVTLNTTEANTVCHIQR
jgi:hypothetical protein